MSKQKTSSKIETAWALGEDQQKLKAYYQKWAKSYDDDVAHEKYFAPKVAVDLILKHVAPAPGHEMGESLRNASVLDAGCGTGLVGALLVEIGVKQLRGFDLSTEMIARAKQKGVYNKLWQGIDLNESLIKQIDAGDFDVVTCIGVLTQGHVPPMGLARLIEVTRINGYIVLNARDTYVREHDFDAYCDGLQDEGRLKFHYRDYHTSSGDSQALFVVAQRMK